MSKWKTDKNVINYHFCTWFCNRALIAWESGMRPNNFCTCMVHWTNLLGSLFLVMLWERRRFGGTAILTWLWLILYSIDCWETMPFQGLSIKICHKTCYTSGTPMIVCYNFLFLFFSVDGSFCFLQSVLLIVWYKPSNTVLDFLQ